MKSIILVISLLAFYLTGFQIFSILNYGVTAFDATLGVFYLIVFGSLIFKSQVFKITKSMLSVSFGLFALSIVISGMFVFFRMEAPQIMQYLKTISHLSFLMIFFFICISYPIELKRISLLIKVWIITSLLINTFGIYQIFARAYDLPLAWLDYNNVSFTLRGAAETESISQLSLKFGNFFRATSIFPEPTAFATYNLHLFVFLLVPYVAKTKHFIKNKFVNILALILCIISLLLAFSLTGMFGLVLILFFMMLLESNRARGIIIALFIAGGVLIITADSIVSEYTDTSVVKLFSKRITGIMGKGSKLGGETTAGESFEGRVESGEQTIDIWKEYPIFGIGSGLTQFGKDVTIVYSDYSILAALAELGIIGASCFVLFFASLFYYSFKAMKSARLLSKEEFDKKRLYITSFYILLIQFTINFVAGNNLATQGLWYQVLFASVPIYNYLLETNDTIVLSLSHIKISKKN